LEVRLVALGFLDRNTNGIWGPDAAGAIANVFDVRHISAQQLAQLGIQQIVYVKPVVINGSACFAIHAADGTPIAIAEGLDVAIAAIISSRRMRGLVLVTHLANCRPPLLHWYDQR
jgi:hypothetical protein